MDNTFDSTYIINKAKYDEFVAEVGKLAIGSERTGHRHRAAEFDGIGRKRRTGLQHRRRHGGQRRQFEQISTIQSALLGVRVWDTTSAWSHLRRPPPSLTGEVFRRR